ncbi:Abi family protein [Caulobacter sp. ErkDOM-YI]|uniref:Abi family protein n=1 Tax=unclassified Caulobacter TaxID=2648921 RepID=UPI003AF8E255
MQLPSAPSGDRFQIVEKALQSQRVGRYLPAAGRSNEKALEYYIWNLSLSECFIAPLHYAEIVCRNALHNGLVARAGDQWYLDKTFNSLLDDRYSLELATAVGDERRQHRDRMTSHHVVSALTFGFWEHLTTKRFERYLWARGISAVFPCAPKGKTHEDLQRLIESVRRWRNRIAHHRAIFDRGPMRKHADALELIRWACGETSSWVASNSRVPAVISLRPKP